MIAPEPISIRLLGGQWILLLPFNPVYDQQKQKQKHEREGEERREGGDRWTEGEERRGEIYTNISDFWETTQEGGELFELVSL